MDIEAAITRIRTATERVDEALEGVTLAREALQREALKALVAIDGDEERLRELVRRLYWEVDELPVKTLEAVVGSAQRVRQLAGPGPLVGACDGCGTEVHATSRTNLASGRPRCPPCERARRRALTAPRPSDWSWSASRAPADPEALAEAVPPEWYDELDRLDELDQLDRFW